MRSNDTPGHNFNDSVNRRLYEKVKKKEREIAEIRNKFMSQLDDFEKRHDRRNAEKSKKFDEFSTLYGSDTDEDEWIQDLEQNIKSAEEKFNRENAEYYDAALNKLENKCKNLFTAFRQE